MTLITKKEITDLHNTTHDICISIFIPTHRGGKKVLQEEDPLALKNQLKDVKHKLEEKGLNADSISKFTEPIQKLIDDSSFWREQSDGLALFVADDIFHKYTLPVYFQDYNYVSNAFYLKPLMPMFAGDGSFFLLSLNRDDVKLYECTKHSFTEYDIEDLIPETKQDRVGFDYEEKNLQFRSGATGSGQAMYHGQEAATGKRKNEIKKYFRAINDGLAEIFKDESMPLLIVAQTPLFDIYKEVNTYSHTLEDNLVVDFSSSDMFDIHELAWERMEPVFDQPRKEHIAKFMEQQGKGTTAIGIGKILPAAINGQIEALFCENNEDIFGTYGKEDDLIEVTEGDDDGTTISLMNLAAIQTFLNGGAVYLMEKEDMPNSNSRVNALYRY